MIDQSTAWLATGACVLVALWCLTSALERMVKGQRLGAAISAGGCIGWIIVAFRVGNSLL